MADNELVQFNVKTEIKEEELIIDDSLGDYGLRQGPETESRSQKTEGSEEGTYILPGSDEDDEKGEFRSRTSEMSFDNPDSHLLNRNYRCKSCRKKFYSVVGLRSHKLVVHKVPAKESETTYIHYCRICGAIFSSKYELKLHTKRSHSGQLFFWELFPMQDGLNKTYTRVIHLLVDEVTGQEVCLGFFDQMDHSRLNFLDISIKISTGMYPCTQCQMSFVTEEFLIFHCRLSHKRNARLFYECEYCPEIRYFRLQDLVSHHDVVCPKRYICSHCNMGFVMKETLKRHVSARHVPRECGMCGKLAMCERTVQIATSQLRVCASCYVLYKEMPAM